MKKNCLTSPWPKGVPQPGHLRCRVSRLRRMHSLQKMCQHLVMTTSFCGSGQQGKGAAAVRELSRYVRMTKRLESCAGYTVNTSSLFHSGHVNQQHPKQQ